MKTLHARHTQKGNALLAVLGTATVLAAFSAAALQMTGGQNRTAARQRSMAKQLAAADGAMEFYYAQWKKALADNHYSWLNAQELSAIKEPYVAMHPKFQEEGVVFSNATFVLADPWGSPINENNPNGYESESDIPLGGFPEFNLNSYPGWVGYTHYYRASVRASLPKTPGSPAVQTEVVRYFQITSVPLFQCLAFFEEELELHPGPNMNVHGKLHTNRDAWICGRNKLRLFDEVSYAATYNETPSPELAKVEDWTGGGQLPWWADDKQSPTSTTKSDQLTAVSRIEPFGAEAASVIDETDANPNNDGFRELIEMPDTNYPDIPEIAKNRLYNKAGVIITIDSSKAVGDAGRIAVSGTGLSSSNKSDFAKAVGSTTNLYDRREGKSVPTTAINIPLLNTALKNFGGFNGVLYVYDKASGTNAVRLQQGAEIERQLTVVSPDPIYIQGDFNTGGGSTSHDPNKVPSNKNGNPDGTDSPIATNYTKQSVAVIGDVVTVLSNNWNDANANKDISNRVASHTTVNAAVMTGFIPTDYKDNNAPSGGAHNIFRLLENWGSKDYTYTGSVAQLYISKEYKGLYSTGQIYSPPNRMWNFDTDLLTVPPAGAVNATVFSRGRWEHTNILQ